MIDVDNEAGMITLPVRVNMVHGVIEYLLCTPFGKVHECFLVTSVSPVELQTALILLNCEPANEAFPPDQSFTNPHAYLENDTLDSFKVYLEFQHKDKLKRKRVEQYFIDPSSREKYKHFTWFFKGLQWDKNRQMIAGNQVNLISTYFDSYSVLCLNSELMLDDTLIAVSAGKFSKGMTANLILKKRK